MPQESSHSPSEAPSRPARSASLQGAAGGEEETRGGKKKRGGRKVQTGLHQSPACAVIGA